MKGSSAVRGCIRRHIDLRALDAAHVVGWMEDDFHHFGIEIAHRDAEVADVRVRWVRGPYSTCSGSGLPLRELIGKPLIAYSSEIGALIEMRLHCTHLFDVAGLLLAHAHRGESHRFYQAVIEDPCPGEEAERTAQLWRDGGLVLDWRLLGRTFVLPDGEAVPIDGGFRAWTAKLDPETAEYALVLRRVAFISFGRGKLGQRDRPLAKGVCYTYQPENIARAVRSHDRRDYSEDAAAMLPFVGQRP